MKFRTYFNSILVEADISFYTSSCTKLIIDNIELSVDIGIPYHSYDYFTFCTNKVLDDYRSLLFFKKYHELYLYYIDYSKIYVSSTYLKKLNSLILNIPDLASKIGCTYSALLNFCKGYNCLPLSKGYALSSVLSINPEEFIEYQADFNSLSFLRDKCIKKK